MPKLSLSTNQINYIKAHRLEESGAAMARKFGVKKNVVGAYMRKHGLTVPLTVKGKFKSEVLKNRTTSDAKTDKFIKQNYLHLPVKYMAAKINRSNCFTRKRMK